MCFYVFNFAYMNPLRQNLGRSKSCAKVTKVETLAEPALLLCRTWQYSHSNKTITIPQPLPFCLICHTWGLEWGVLSFYYVNKDYFRHFVRYLGISLMHTDLVKQMTT